VHGGQFQVGDDQVGFLFDSFLQTELTIPRGNYLPPFGLEKVVSNKDDILTPVFNYQYLARHPFPSLRISTQPMRGRCEMKCHLHYSTKGDVCQQIDAAKSDDSLIF
jgi:hypothetical protein